MIKFMLVEDEPPILKSIKKTIESISEQYRVAACAEDGREALTRLETDQPDVLITDVHMPMMDGLELLERVKKNYPEIICIILSGYREFEYVQQSLRLGVYDYLLKPVSKDAVMKVMTKVEKELSTRGRDRVDDFLQSLIYYGHGDATPELMDLFADYSGFTVANITAGSIAYDPGNIKQHCKSFWQKVDIGSDILEKCSSDERLWTVQGKNSNVLYLVIASKSSDETLKSYTASKIYLAVNRYDVPVTMTLSETFHDIGALPKMASEVRERMQSKSIYNKSQLIMATDDPVDRSRRTSDKKLLEEIMHYVAKGNHKSLIDAVDRLVNHWEASSVKQVVMEDTLLQLVTGINKYNADGGANKADGYALKVNETVCRSKDYRDLHQNLVDLIEGMSFREGSRMAGQHRNHRNLVMEVEKYLRDNHTRKINNKQLAEEFFLSPSYISKIYKEHFGVSTYQYLIRIRIDEAKRILVESPMMKLKDVSELTGFGDIHYFCKAFKKETGYSPTEYRMNHVK